ncbi:MAG: hypothetical protein BWY36_00357 [Candidatus Diapherotrites archaeon ADurb.Bin253]|jgi:uncharacterized membrane protein|nr:hypothetical protein [Candidatus Pacearchaeota archaeon]OQA68452.1 MAG: hypothetical protein BWY36_00357 [Candidatus Diapherotrites archaeon ADurb.Bin253]HNZ52373.1 hypothetical protein [Candidatus Pacearchaeota archaeon]HOH04388.1 hypothetical protein [Candidatus Pacearchaeota archaeon]HOU79075.1 hypothetical protein [Candidatus Pacearchaeota archaeon]
MEERLIAAAFGCVGGLTRSFIGIFKAKARHDKIKLGYVVRTMKLSFFSGALIGALLGFNYLVSFIAGYVGSDAMEGAVDSIKRTKFGKKHLKNLK